MPRFRPEPLSRWFLSVAFGSGMLILLVETTKGHADPVLTPAALTLVMTSVGSVADRGRRDRLDRLEAEYRRRQRNGHHPDTSPGPRRKPR